MAISEGVSAAISPEEGSAARAEFDRRYNLSYLDPNLPAASYQQVLRHYLVSALLYGAALLFVTVSPWFRGLLQIPILGDPDARLHIPAWWIYVYAYAAYLTIAPLVYFTLRPRSLWTSFYSPGIWRGSSG